MNLSEKEVKEYEEFLRDYKKVLDEFVPVLTPRAARFADLVVQVMLKRDMTTREFAKTYHCALETVWNACKVIKQKKLPFKYKNRLECRRLERLLGGGLKEQKLATGFSRYKKKHTTIR